MSTNKNQNETELKKEKKTVKEAETSILITLYMGLFSGMVPVVGFPITIPEMGGKILFIGIILAIAAFISFFFLGTLFGMPKRNNEKESDYSLNNSLVEISDWLTKIIVGLGLVNLKEIPGFLISLGEYVRASSRYDGQLLNIYSIGIVIYFGFLGLYIGYNYMRLVLSNKYKYADDNLIRKELEMANEKIHEIKEEIQQKDKKIIQTQSLVQEKEQLTKSLMTKVNEPSMSSTDFETAVQKIITSDEAKGKENIKSDINKMIDEAKLKLHKGLILNPEDPQKGQWKSNAINNERELKATVTEEIKGLYKINLKVVSTNSKNNPLQDGEYVLFALHNTFGNPPFKLVQVNKQSAELNFYSYGSFTVGAFAENGATELELDLAELPDVSTYFKTH
ncbi:pYEATS domain-containing protein [Flavobacterium aestuarii]|uniref:pYEATS domain-containing protein n=1 Tax=Flavobacterium aestuarii TaxID=3149227 RepID=UPI0032B5A2ED